MRQNHQTHREEVEWWLPGAEGVNGGPTVQRIWFQFCKMKRYEDDSGNNCTTQMYVTPLKCIYNTDGKFYVHFSTPKKRIKKGYMDT